MWKSFIYNDVNRIAWIAPKGPAYQVFPEPGFRSFKSEKMRNVKSTHNRFKMILHNDLEDYPELEQANA